MLNLRFRYDVSPISLYSLKVPRFWQAKVGHGLFGVKNMVLMKYPKILTGVLLDILIKCRPKIVVLFKSPKIFTRKIGHGVFGVKKYGSYETSKILTGVLLEILIQCRPKISVLFRNPKILTSKIGHGFLASRNMVLIKQPRFWRVFYLKFWYNVGATSLFS